MSTKEWDEMEPATLRSLVLLHWEQCSGKKPQQQCEPCGSSSISGMTVGVPSHVRSGESEVNTRGELFEKAALFAIYLVPLI